MATAAALVIVALLVAAPSWGDELGGKTARVVCAIVGTSPCPARGGERSSSPVAERVATDPGDARRAWASSSDGELTAKTHAAKDGGGVGVSRHLEWRSRSDALSDFGFRDPKRCKGRSVQSAYCFGPDGTLRYCRDETIHDELRRRLQSQEVFCDAALHDDVILKTIPADCGVAPNVQVDGTPTDEWICRFVLDSGGIVFARCTETLPGQRTCIDVEQDAYRATDPKAVVCRSGEFSIATAGSTQTGLRVCSSPGGGVYACTFTDTVKGALATDSPIPARCDRRIFPLDPEISCRLTGRKQPSPDALETRCLYGTTPIVCLEYTRQVGDLVHCATTPTVPTSTDPCKARLQVPGTLANPGRHLVAKSRDVSATLILALMAYLRDQGPTVVERFLACPAQPPRRDPDLARSVFENAQIIVQVIGPNGIVAQTIDGVVDLDLHPNPAQLTALNGVFQHLVGANLPAGVHAHVQIHDDGAGAAALPSVGANGIVHLGIAPWAADPEGLNPVVVQGVLFHAAHPEVAVQVVPDALGALSSLAPGGGLEIPLTGATNPAQVAMLEALVGLQAQHPGLHPDTLAAAAFIQALPGQEDDLDFDGSSNHLLALVEALHTPFQVPTAQIVAFILEHDLGTMLDTGEDQNALLDLLTDFVLAHAPGPARDRAQVAFTLWSVLPA